MSSERERLQAQREERDRQREHEVATTGLQQATQQDSFEQQKAQFLDKLTETGMSDAATGTLDNMVDQTFVLGHLTSAETHEIKWRLHTMFLKIKAIFPPQESVLQGPFRAFVYDDRDEDITALTDKQEIIISQMIIGITAYVSRSREGVQLEHLVKSVNVSEVRNPEEEQSDSLMDGLVS